MVCRQLKKWGTFMSFKAISIQIIAFAAISSMLACSGGGGGGGSTDTKAAPANNQGPGDQQNPGQQNPGQTNQGTTALTKNFWCRSISQNNANHQLRLEFSNNGKFALTVFQLTANGRGQQEMHNEGTYSIQGQTLVLTADNKPENHTIRLDPESPTGAPQLNVDNAPYDPCN
jgi:hypothetical protein